jgi:hypothetical protein
MFLSDKVGMKLTVNEEFLKDHNDTFVTSIFVKSDLASL